MIRLSFAVPEEMLKALRRVSKETQIPQSVLMRNWISNGLKSNGEVIKDKPVWGGKREKKSEQDQ